jgi:hypothetical protein
MDHILMLLLASESALDSMIMRAARNRAGFEYENRNMMMYLSVDEQKIGMCPDFREVQKFDYRESRRWARRQKQMWKWVNEHLFR